MRKLFNQIDSESEDEMVEVRDRVDDFMSRVEAHLQVEKALIDSQTAD